MRLAISQLAVKKNNIFIIALWGTKAARDYTQLGKAQLIIKMNSGGIIFDHRIKLQYPKAQLFGYRERIEHQFFANMQAALRCCYGIAGIGQMTAATDIVGV